MSLSGQCLCGGVKFEAAPSRSEMGVCHCGMCRRWSGGAFMGVQCADLKIADESQLGVYKSSDWGERCFCKQCGATLFWRTQDHSVSVVSAQAFDDPAQFAFTSEIYIDSQPSNYAFADADKRKRMTAEQFLAAFMASKGG